MKYLDIPSDGIKIAPPYYDCLADEISEAWVQRFCHQRQAQWLHLGW